MTISQYTNVQMIGDKICVRGISKAGERLTYLDVDYNPTVWVPLQFNFDTNSVNIVDVQHKKWHQFVNKQPLTGLVFDNIASCKRFIRANNRYIKDEYGKSKLVSKVYTAPGNHFVPQFINETFKDPIAINSRQLKVYNYDIETEVGGRRAVDDDTIVHIKKKLNTKGVGGLFDQQQQQQTMTIHQFEQMPGNSNWLIQDPNTKQWLDYNDHPYRSFGGFPNPDKAEEKITLITVKDVNAKQIYTWGLTDYRNDRQDVQYRKFDSEYKMLEDFVNWFSSDYPDVLSGWNCLNINSSVWMKDKIVRLSDIKQSDKLADSDVVKVSDVSVKDEYLMTNKLGQVISCSKDHIFPVVVNGVVRDLSVKQIKHLVDQRVPVKAIVSYKVNKNEGLTNRQFIKGACWWFYENCLSFTDIVEFENIINHKDTLQINVGGLYNTTIHLDQLVSESLLFSVGKMVGQQQVFDTELLSQLSPNQFGSYLVGCCEDFMNLHSRSNIMYVVVPFKQYNEQLFDLCLWNGYIPTIEKDKTYDVHDDCLFVDIQSVEQSGKQVKMIDIETTTHYFYTQAIKTHNCSAFDNTYVARRVKKVLGEQLMNKLSPFGQIDFKVVPSSGFGTDVIETSWSGIATLDYLKMYKTFKPGVKESYKLDAIASDEIKAHKIANPTGGTFKDFYTGVFDVRGTINPDDHQIRKLGYQRTKMHDQILKNNLNNVVDQQLNDQFEKLNAEIIDMCQQLFVRYNIRDVELIDQLDEKLRFVDLVMTIAYASNCNYEDVFSKTRTWDNILYNHINSLDCVIPMKGNASKDQKYAGAYVKSPLVGKHDFCMSYDLDSLYPHLIMEYNISPETLVRDKNGNPVICNVDLDSLVHKQQDMSFAKQVDYSVCSSGVCFKRERQGLLPFMCDKFYKERKANKKKMLHYKSEHEKVVEEMRKRKLIK